MNEQDIQSLKEATNALNDELARVISKYGRAVRINPWFRLSDEMGEQCAQAIIEISTGRITLGEREVTPKGQALMDANPGVAFPSYMVTR